MDGTTVSLLALAVFSVVLLVAWWTVTTDLEDAQADIDELAETVDSLLLDVSALRGDDIPGGRHRRASGELADGEPGT